MARPEVLGHAHKHGGQIQTLKKKLHKLNANAQYTYKRNVTESYLAQCHYGWYFSDLTFFCGAVFDDLVSHDRARWQTYCVRSLVRMDARVFGDGKQCPTPGGSKAAFGCPSEFAWLETVGIRRSFLLTAIARQEQLFQVFARAIVSVFV